MEQQSISSDLIRGHIDTIILYSLLENDKHAQQISDYIENKSNNEYKINQATLYSSLKRLESLKHVESYWNDAKIGRRKYFHLTEKGKSVVETNLSSWSYSKQIIDRLMDCKTNVTASPQIIYVSKPTAEEQSNHIDATNQTVTTQRSEQEVVTENKPEITSQNQTNDCTKPNGIADSTGEKGVNFRLILNDLIKNNTSNVTSVTSKQENVSEKPNESIEFEQSTNNIAVTGLNESLKTDYTETNLHFDGKIDFTDLKAQATQDGYKIRISSKDSALPDGTLKINKLNFISAILTLLIAVIEFVPMYLYCKPYIPVKTLNLILFALLVCAYPIFCFIRYLISPKTTTTKRIHADSILTCAIIVFNLLLALFAVTFLLDMDFNSKVNLVKYIYTPVALMIDVILYFTLRFFLSKSKCFYRSK